MVLWPQDVHAVAEGLLFEEGLFVLLMSDALLHDMLFHTLCLLDVSAPCLKDRVHLRAQANAFGNGAPSTLVLHLPQHLFVGVAVQWVILQVIRGVVGVLHFDLEEETVGVEELTLVPVLLSELVVIEVVHPVFRDIQNAHPYTGRLSSRWLLWTWIAAVIDEDIGPSKRRAGDEAPEFVRTSFTSTHFRRFSMVFPKTELFISL